MTELARKVLDLSNFELYLTNFVLGKGWVKNKILPEKYLRQNHLITTIGVELMRHLQHPERNRLL